MELTNKELELIALHRVAPPYRKRIIASCGITAALLLAVGIPSDGHIWGIVVNITILITFVLFCGWQTKRIDYAKQGEMEKFSDVISPDGGLKLDDKQTAAAR